MYFTIETNHISILDQIFKSIIKVPQNSLIDCQTIYGYLEIIKKDLIDYEDNKDKIMI